MNFRGSWLLRAGVSALLVALLLRRYDLAATFAELSGRLQAGWLLAAVGVFAVSVLGGAQQWTWLLAGAGIHAPRAALWRLYLVGLFFNNFLPANVGGDAVKVLDLGRREGRTAVVFGATLVDRLLGLGALAMLGLIAVAWGARSGAAALPVMPLAVVLGGILLLLPLLLTPALSGPVGRLVRMLPWPGWRDRFVRIDDALRVHGRRWGRLAALFLFALLVQLLRVATHLLAARALGFDLDGQRALLLLALVPVLGILITLPVSINGIGLRETAAADLFVAAGIVADGGSAVAIELVAFAIQLIVSLAGGVLFLLGEVQTARTGRDGNR